MTGAGFIFKKKHTNYFCIPITFNNPLKACFSNKNIYIYYNPNAPDTNCKSIFLNEKKKFLADFKRLLVYKFNYL